MAESLLARMVNGLSPVELVELHDAVRDVLIRRGIGTTDPYAICVDREELVKREDAPQLTEPGD